MPRGAKRWLVALPLLLAAAPAAAAPQARSLRIAVVPIGHVNLAEAEANLIAGTLAVNIEERYAVRAIAPGPSSPECANDPSCVATLAESSAADRMLFVILTRVGDHVQIDAILADPASGTIEARGPIQLELNGPTNRTYAVAAAALVPELPRRRHRERRNTAAWIVGGAGATSLILGVGLGISALALDDDRDGDCQGPDRRDCEAARDRVRRRTLAAEVALAAGVVAVGVSTYLFLRDPDDSGVQVSASPTDIALHYTVRF